MLKQSIQTCTFVLLGAVTTITVAWSCAMFSELNEQPDIAFHSAGIDKGWWFSAFSEDGFGATRREVSTCLASTDVDCQLIVRPQMNQIRITDDQIIIRGAGYLSNPPSLAPQVHMYPIDHSRWSRQGLHPNFDGSKGRFVDEEGAFGWPMYAMWCSYYTMPWEKDENGKRHFDPAEYEAVLQIPESLQQLSPITLENHHLPLQPIALGFAGNTVLYSSVWWIALIGIARARRHLRRAQGKCICCAYDLRGITSERCPECGIVANCT